MEIHPQVLQYVPVVACSDTDSETPMASPIAGRRSSIVGPERKLEQRKSRDIPNFQDELAKSRVFGYGLGHFEDGSSIADMTDDIFFDRHRSMASQLTGGNFAGGKRKLCASAGNSAEAQLRGTENKVSLEMSDYDGGISDRSESPRPGELHSYGTSIYAESVINGGESPFADEFCRTSKEHCFLASNKPSEEDLLMNLESQKVDKLREMDTELLRLEAELVECHQDKDFYWQGVRGADRTPEHIGCPSIASLPLGNHMGSRVEIRDSRIWSVVDRFAAVRRKMFTPTDAATDTETGTMNPADACRSRLSESLASDAICSNWLPPCVEDAEDTGSGLDNNDSIAAPFVTFSLNGYQTVREKMATHVQELNDADEEVPQLNHDEMKSHLMARFDSHRIKKLRKGQEFVRQVCSERDDEDKSAKKWKWGRKRFLVGKGEAITPTRAEKKNVAARGRKSLVEIPPLTPSRTNVSTVNGPDGESPVDDAGLTVLESEEDAQLETTMNMVRWLYLLHEAIKWHALAIKHWADFSYVVQEALKEHVGAVIKHKELWIVSKWFKDLQGLSANGGLIIEGTTFSNQDTAQTHGATMAVEEANEEEWKTVHSYGSRRGRQAQVPEGRQA